MKQLILLLMFLYSSVLFAVKPNYYYTEQERNTLLAVGMSSSYLQVSDSNDIDFEGIKNSLNIGVASAHFDSWLFDTSLQIILGPNNKQDMKVDFNGTGFSARAAYSFVGPFRSNSKFGPSLSAAYEFLSGKNPTSYSNIINGETITSWSMKTRSLVLTPALSFRSFKKARVVTNDPTQLITRVDGWMVSLGVTIPTYMEYSLKKTSKEDGNESRSGDLSGYSIELSGSIFLGI